MSVSISQNIIVGSYTDYPIRSSSGSLYKSSFMGDTMRLALPRTPADTGLQGEMCWSVLEAGPVLYLCTQSQVNDENGSLVTPAVWYKSVLVAV